MAGEITACDAACENLNTIVNDGLASCWGMARFQIGAALVNIRNKICEYPCIRDASELPNADPLNFDTLWGPTQPPFPCDCLFLYVIKDNDIWFKRSDTLGGWSLLTAAPQTSIIHVCAPDTFHGVDNMVTSGDSLVASERLYASGVNNPSMFRSLNCTINYSADMALYKPPLSTSLAILQFTAARNAGGYDRKLHIRYDGGAANAVGATAANSRYDLQDVVAIPPSGAMVISTKGNFIQTLSPDDAWLTMVNSLVQISGVTE